MKRILLFMLIASLATACDDVFEKKLDGKAVTVVAPVDGTTVTEGTVTFLWVPMEGANGYHITIVSPSFETAAIVVADTLLVDDSVSVRRMFRQAFSAGDYQWSISAFNSAYSSAASVFDLHVVALPEPALDTTSTATAVAALLGRGEGAGAENGMASACGVHCRPVGERDGERLRSTARSTFPQPERPTDRSPQPTQPEQPQP